uniref:Peroxiredoxin-like 2A n=1 Tax=Lates calcarifer TaxID=8187 RepID=A0A4W6C4R4_LATCA
NVQLKTWCLVVLFLVLFWLQEAAELSSLKPQLDELGVPLYAVVKEDVGTEVQNFRPYFKGEIFLDEKVDFFFFFSLSEWVYCVVSFLKPDSASLAASRLVNTLKSFRICEKLVQMSMNDSVVLVCVQRRFYGPRERKMGLLAFLRVGVWMNGLRAFKKGFMGNVFGEGFVLGGVFVIGRGQQGILMEHREIEFGDKVNIEDVIQAARRIAQELLPIEKK